MRCVVMQGGQGEVKHWAFNDPVRREGKYKDNPPSPEEYRRLSTRIVNLHPITLIQNARTSGGGVVQNVPNRALTAGPVETWKAEKVSIWHAGTHDNPFGMRLTTLMTSKRIPNTRPCQRRRSRLTLRRSSTPRRSTSWKRKGVKHERPGSSSRFKTRVGAAAWERLQTRLAEVNRDTRTRGIRTVRGIEGGALAGFGTNLLTGYAYEEFYDWDLYFENIVTAQATDAA